MIVKNEEKNIKKCLSSAKSYVDEIIIVDTGSTDNTIKLCKHFTDKIYYLKWEDDFSAARNYSISKAKHDWILILDADEVITYFNQNEIQKMITNNRFVGNVSIKSLFDDHGSTKHYLSRVSRFIHRSNSFTGNVHEQVKDGIRVDVPIEIDHTGYYKTTKHDRNIQLLKKELKRNPDDAYYLYQIANEYKGLDENNDALNYFNLFYKHKDNRFHYTTFALLDFLYLLKDMKRFKRGLEVIKENHTSLNQKEDFHFFLGLFYNDLILQDINKFQHLFVNIESSYKMCLKIGESGEGVLGTGSFLAAFNLGLLYEMMGKVDRAQKYYEIADSSNFKLAKERLIDLKK